MLGSVRGQFSAFQQLGSADNYPSPWLDIASMSMPTNMRSALLWAEYVFGTMGSYRMAMERVIAYFLTDFDIVNASDDETDKWKKFLTDTLDLMTALQNIMRDRMCYGNSFSSLLVPFKRFLRCPRAGCGAQFLLREVYENKIFNFEWSMPNFIATCPRCKVGSGYRGPWRVDDRDDDRERKLKIKRWSPHEIEILHDQYSDDAHYIWRIPEDYKSMVRRGHLFHLERVSKQVLKAIHENLVYRFHPDAIFHMKEPTLAGVVNRSWGIPRVFTNFRQIWYVQVLRRFNEAIALDYVIPFRVITPAPRQGSSAGGGMSIDPMMAFGGGDFRSQVVNMIRRRRYDPAAMQVLPFPVNFQMFGADANKLAPVELLKQGYETLLNDSGTPMELYNGSLQLQAAPMALRLFESTWRHLVHDANACLQWVVRQSAQILSWEAIEAELRRVTVADDVEQAMVGLQMQMSGQLSGTTAFAGRGWNWKKEQKQIAEESQYQAELQARTQEELQQAGFGASLIKGTAGGQQGGAPQQGGQSAGGDPNQPQAPPPPVTAYMASTSPNTPISLQDLMSTADSLAQDLLGRSSGEVRSELRKLKISNPTLYSVVKQRMEQQRNATRQQGGNQAVASLQRPQQ